MLRDVTAEVLARYEGDYVAGKPAITRNSYGDGFAYYVACRTNQNDIEFLYREMLEHAGIAYTKLPVGVEKHTRFADDAKYDFYLNGNTEDVTVKDLAGVELLTGENVSGTLVLKGYGVAVVKR